MSEFRHGTLAEVGIAVTKALDTGSCAGNPRAPDMACATVLQAPRRGVKALSVNLVEVFAVPGITHVVPLAFGVAVVGTSTEAVRTARQVLRAHVTWSASTAMATAGGAGEGVLALAHEQAALAGPASCTAQVSRDGRFAQLWMGPSIHADAVAAVADYLGTATERISVNQPRPGDGGARPIAPQFAVQAVAIAQEIGLQVRLLVGGDGRLALAG